MYLDSADIYIVLPHRDALDLRLSIFDYATEVLAWRKSDEHDASHAVVHEPILAMPEAGGMVGSADSP